MLDEPQVPAPIISVKDWMITLLITFIPIVGIVMYFVWAFGSDTNPTKANWAKATLIWALIWIVISIIFFSLFGAAMIAMMGAASSQGY